MHKAFTSHPEPAATRLTCACSRSMSWFSSSRSKLKSLGLAFLLTLSQTALGEGLRVSPLKLEFNEDSNSALVRISNDGAEKFNVQLDAMSWTQDDTGQDQHTPTSDIVFFPRIFSVEPGDQRIARVGYEGEPAGSKELTYRLYAQELPVEEPVVMEMKVKPHH